MKRFFAIFGICFGSLVVFLGGYLGVKWLIGDFNPEVIMPEKITFQQTEYYFDEGQESYSILISTDTEGVTETKVTLQIENGGRQTADKSHWTDGVIIIPKTAKLNEPFEVSLVKDNTYASELNDEALNNWIRGGISNIIATSQNIKIAPAKTTVYVDTPVYKTELVVLNKEQASFNFANQFKNVEYSNFSTVIDNDNLTNIRAGETFYIGLKYYPSASAFKYNKISSTNAFVQYKNEITQKLAEYDVSFEEFLNGLNSFCQDKQEKSFQDVLNMINTWCDLITADEALNTFFEDIFEQFDKNLKYNNILEKTATSKTELVEKVSGTNLCKLVATQNLGIADFYSYTFKKTVEENNIIANMQEDADIYDVLESAYQSGKVIRNTNSLNIVDVEVDTIKLNGSMEDIRTGEVFTIYASKNGDNNVKTSYLNIDLSNSILQDINLKDKISRVGIKFERKLGTEWIDASDAISLKNEQNYQKIEILDNKGNLKETYFRPYGTANYWEVFANRFVEGEFRIVVKYFIEYEKTIQVEEVNPETNEIELKDKVIKAYEEVLLNTDYPTFNLIETTSATENLISWTDTTEITQKIVKIFDTVSIVNPVVVIPEFDLSTLVNRTQLNKNVYTTTRYFIYSSDGEKLSDYFNTVNKEAITYNFDDGSVDLYELPSSVLKLISVDNVPTGITNAIYITVKTDINGTPIYANEEKGIYEFVKYSATKDNMLEKLSSIPFSYEKSLSKLTGEVEISEDAIYKLAGVEGRNYNSETNYYDVYELWLAQNSQNVLTVTVSAVNGEEARFEEAVKNGQIKVVAKNGIDGTENYINYIIKETAGGECIFAISTREVSKDTSSTLYIVYSVQGIDYYFKLSYNTTVYKADGSSGTKDITIDQAIIKSDISPRARFHITCETEDGAGSLLMYSHYIQNITIQRVFNTVTNKLEDRYTLNITEAAEKIFGPVTSFGISDVFNDNGVLKTDIYNFLGYTDNSIVWNFTSSNPSVATVGENNILSFVGSGETTIKLFVNGESEAKDEVTIIFINDGYVSGYAYTDLGKNYVQNDFNGTDKVFNKTNISVSRFGESGEIKLQDSTEIEIETNKSLFAMWYYISESNIKLNFDVKLVGEESIKNYCSITGANIDEISQDTILGNTFKLAYNLGAPLTLVFAYTCKEIPTINIRVTLTLNAYISVSNINVVEKDNLKLTPVKTDVYSVYSGYEYTFNTTLNNAGADENIPYYYLKDKDTFTPIKTNTNGVKLVEGTANKFIFDDVNAEKDIIIYVSNKAESPKAGELQKAITFKIKPNVVISKYVIDNNYAINIELDENGIATYDVLNQKDNEDNLMPLFVREKTDSNGLDTGLFDLTALSSCSYSNGIITFSFTDINVFTNSIVKTLSFKYAGKSLTGITFVITPKNYEQTDATRIAVYNGEKAIVLVNGVDETINGTPETVLKQQFGPDISNISLSGNISEYIASNKIAVASSFLFTDTGAKYIVQDQQGNNRTYRIILSQVEYPFVNINSTKVGFSLKDIDIYKVYVSLNDNQLLKYFNDNELNVGIGNFYGAMPINLLANNDSDKSSVYTILNDKSAYLSYSYSLINSKEDANKYIDSIDSTKENELITNLVGSKINVLFVLKYKIGGYTYNIPTIITINKSQKIDVNYEYDDRELENYGLEEYDTEYMFKSEDYNNGKFEYAKFDLNGEAKVEISSERFTVSNFNGSIWESVDYTGELTYSIEKLYTCNQGVWTEVTNNLNLYAIINSNVISLSQRGVTAIRVKVEVKTDQGAINYYYIEVNNSSIQALYKKVGTTEVNISKVDTIAVITNDTIEFANASGTSTFNYYLKNNNDQLKFKVLSGQEFATINTKIVTIGIAPNGGQLIVEAYTIYGRICLITINIASYYTAELKNGVLIYSGTDVSINDILSLKSADGTTATSIELINETVGAIEFEKYDIINGKLRFAHSKTNYVISNLTFYVKTTVNGKDYKYLVNFNNVEVIANIIVKSPIIAVNFGEVTENGGKIEIAKEQWENLFTINSDPYDKANKVKYILKYNAQDLDITGKSKQEIEVGNLTSISKLDLSFIIAVTNINGETIKYIAPAKITVKPQYTVVINYSQGKDTSFNAEYVQTGSTVDFTKATINGLDRIKLYETTEIGKENPTAKTFTLTLKNSNNEVIETGITSYKFENAGEYYLEIIFEVNGENVVYGIYNLIVSDNPAISIDVSNIDDATFYAGYGHDKIFNYVDLVVTTPNLPEGVNTFSIVSKISNDVNITIAETVYYNGLSQKIRAVATLEDYAKGINEQNIYAKYKIGEGEDTFVVCPVVITPRYTISYNGAPVDIKYYQNIINTEETGEIIDESEDGNIKSFSCEQKFVCDLTTNMEFSVIYNVTCDIVLNTNEQDVNYTLNANEIKEGLSFVDIFNLQDNLGNKFWLNHISKTESNTKRIDLEYIGHVDANTLKNIDSANAILLEPSELSINKTAKLIYDFSLIAMGATNNGTIVTLKFTFTVGTGESALSFKKQVKIKVMPDIEYSVLNNDGNNTPNSQHNKLVLKNVKNYTLINASQNSTDIANYYIYAYSKYDSSKKNIAQSFNIISNSYAKEGVNLDTDFNATYPEDSGANIYAGWWKDSYNNTIFTYAKNASFGDKQVVLTFTDNYGFTFAYYITLVADSRITGTQITQEAYYEDTSLKVYNKNDPDAGGEGIALNIQDNNGSVDEDTELKISQLEIYTSINGKEVLLTQDAKNVNTESDYYINCSIDTDGPSIKFGYQNQDFWTLGDNDKTVTLNLKIYITKKGETETFLLTASIVLCKKYELTVNEENTYVRDNIEFNIENLVSVYDYSLGTYLGEPSLEIAEAIKLNFNLNTDYTETTAGLDIDYVDGENSYKAKLELTSLNIYKLMRARASTGENKYDSVGDSFKITYKENTTIDAFTDEIADLILNTLNIYYADGVFTQNIKVVATNINSGKKIESKYASINYKYYDGSISCANDNFIYLGEHQTMFGTTELNLKDYNYKIYYVSPTKDDVLIADTSKNANINIEEGKTPLIINPGGELFATTGEVTVLKVASYAESFVLLTDGTDLIKQPISEGINTIYVENAYNTKLSLYTGYIKIEKTTQSGKTITTYIKTTNDGESKVLCYNGFVLASDSNEMKNAKNLKVIELKQKNGEKIVTVNSQSLNKDKSFGIDNDGVLYQDILSNLEYSFISNTYKDSDNNNVETYYTYNKSEYIRVTLQYTGINTSNAYVGSSDIHLIEIASLSDIGDSGLTINMMDVVTGEATNYGWANDFTLIPGVGITKDLALQTEAGTLDFKSAYNKGVLQFSLKAVTTSGGGVVSESSLVKLVDSSETLTVEEGGEGTGATETQKELQLKLLKGFKPSLYYITIEVSCKYPAKETATNGDTIKWQPIGTIRLGFKVGATATA